MRKKAPKLGPGHNDPGFDPVVPDVGDMLGKVLSYEDNKFIESIEIGDLSMRTYYKPIDYIHKPELLECFDSSPEGSFATTWHIGNLSGFRVYIAVIAPETEEPKDDLSLCVSKAESILKSLSNTVILFKEQPR